MTALPLGVWYPLAMSMPSYRSFTFEGASAHLLTQLIFTCMTEAASSRTTKSIRSMCPTLSMVSAQLTSVGITDACKRSSQNAFGVSHRRSV
jgi:hypothetical protein